MSFAWLTVIALAFMFTGWIPVADETVYILGGLATLAMAGGKLL